jgi:hypothetical protein
MLGCRVQGATAAWVDYLTKCPLSNVLMVSCCRALTQLQPRLQMLRAPVHMHLLASAGFASHCKLLATCLRLNLSCSRRASLLWVNHPPAVELASCHSLSGCWLA